MLIVFRFKHHCMDYHGPTVTLLKVGKEGLLIAAIDVEWRLVHDCMNMYVFSI